MAEHVDALNALRNILKTATNSDQSPTTISRGYVYRTQYGTVDSAPPFFVVDKMDGVQNQRGVHTHGVSYDRWMARVILYLYYGEPEHPSAEGAAAVALEEGWPKAFSDALLDNLTLSDTVVKIGDPDGNRLKVFDYQSDYYQWDAEPYWGIGFWIPIMQYVNQGTSV